MKKEFRLLKTNDFQRLINSRSQVSNEAFVVYFQKNELAHIRVGISVSKKNHGGAVQRNLVKRQVRMMCQDKCLLNDNRDYLIIVKHKYHNNNYAKNITLLSALLDKIGDI
jgi:ribonuclease P protein component